MIPVSPVVPGFESREVIYAKDQPEYLPFPVIRSVSGQVTSRWEFTDEERRQIANGASLYLSILTFHQPLQPIIVGVANVQEGDLLEKCSNVIAAIGEQALR